MDELIERAMLGDKNAARELTEQGVAIPCPFCGRDEAGPMYQYNAMWEYYECPVCGAQGQHILRTERNKAEVNRLALLGWNTRPQLVTFCKDCKCYHVGDCIEDNGCRHIFALPDPVDEYQFCSYGEPRED